VPGVTLLSAPVELAGNWGEMIPHSADLVVELMRHACLDGVRLVSDRQPTRLGVDEHTRPVRPRSGCTLTAAPRPG